MHVWNRPVTSPASMPATMAASSATHTAQPLDDQYYADGAAGAQGAVHRQVRNVQNA